MGLAMITYVFGILFTQAVLDNSGVLIDGGRFDLWCSLKVSTLTLFKCISGGLSWHEASEPLLRISPLLELLFAIYISFTYFAVLNVVTGVFCSSAIETAQ